MNAYAEFVDFIVKGMSPDEIMAYRPSAEAEERVEGLIRALKQETISPDEWAELNHHIELENIIRLAKMQAQQYAQKR